MQSAGQPDQVTRKAMNIQLASIRIANPSSLKSVILFQNIAVKLLFNFSQTKAWDFLRITSKPLIYLVMNPTKMSALGVSPVLFVYD